MRRSSENSPKFHSILLNLTRNFQLASAMQVYANLADLLQKDFCFSAFLGKTNRRADETVVSAEGAAKRKFPIFRNLD